MGAAYYHRFGVETPFTTAFTWFQRAAAQGYEQSKAALNDPTMVSVELVTKILSQALFTSTHS